MNTVASLFDPAPGENNLAPRAQFETDLVSQSLNGRWRFHWSADPTSAPVGVEREDFDDSGFDELDVPSSWPMHGYGAPAYTNVQFPFPVDPPHPPDENPVGDHRLRFDADPGLLDGAVLRFDGVDNAGEVWLNGERLGSTRGSRLMVEFDVSSVLRATDNLLVVRVAQFSASSYLEDQDMWWLPGIFRDVTLLATPPGAIRDVFVHADYERGQGRLRVDVDPQVSASVRIDELDVVVATGETVDVGPVEGWSAETPRLYTAVVSTDLETIMLRVGFRTVSVVESQIMINDRPIMIKGVNRHEHHPELGRVVPADVVRRELELMKQHNVNAIRTSHYPPHPQLLGLADELGFYLIVECDYETHGFGLNGWRRNPSDDEVWLPALRRRMATTVHRDKNHPSVFCWSLGNEAGTGQNLAAMAEVAREIDSSRLIHYEGDPDMGDVDVYSRMYASPDLVEQIGRGTEPPTSDPGLDAHRRSLPFLQCEYAHAMGNGPGGLTEYQLLFETYPRLAGGFIWEWLEHGISVRQDGRSFFAYGGDFGEEVHDGIFVIDGLVTADRVPRPGLTDLKKVYEPLRITPADDWRSVAVHNAFDHVGLAGLRLGWSVEVDGEVRAEGELGGVDCPAGADQEISLPAEVAEAAQAAGPGAVLTVSARLAEDRAWAGEGHELAWGQAARPSTPLPPVVADAPSVSDDLIAVGPGRFEAGSGRLVGLGEIAVAGPQLNLWRAPTDNDNGVATDAEPIGNRPAEPESATWARQGLDRLRVRVVSVDVEGEELVVRQRVGPAAADRFVDVTYRWRSDGVRLALRTQLEIGDGWQGSWPRIGLDFELPGGFDQVRWRGRGPNQSYPDTGQGQRWGTFENTVDGLQIDYVRPQENGSRRADRLELAGSDGTRITVGAAEEFGFAARPWSQNQLAAADHVPDLVPDGSVHLTVDHRQHGVGTAACGPGVLPAYRLLPNACSGADLDFELVFEVGAS